MQGFIPFPILHSSRLILNQASDADIPAIYRLRTDPAVNRFIRRHTPADNTEASQWLAKTNKGIEKGENIYWSIRLNGHAEMIGSICLWKFTADRLSCEIGYDLLPMYQRRGYMGEAMQSVIVYGKMNLKLQYIDAYTHRNNESSRRLLDAHHFALIPHKKDQDNADNVIYRLEL